MEEITIDAKNQILGRLATQVATLLRGKDLATFAPNKIPERKVVISNVKNLKFTGNKIEQKMYTTHSGYPGGIRQIPLSKMLEKHPERVLEWAVYGMLPKNRLRAQMMKNLDIRN
jgi:large subunit ribosomal protein L13